MTNLVAVTANKLLISAAYKSVVMAAMLVQANYFSDKTHLPADHPITFQTSRPGGHVAPPRLMGFSGSLLTTNYFFGFSNGRLANFKKLNFFGQDDNTVREKFAKYSMMNSAIDTNKAYQIAKGWLTGLSVDMARMEKQYPPQITQWELTPSGTGALETESKLLPIFKIDWGSVTNKQITQHSLPAITMTIFGPTKELIEFHMIDDTFVTKPKIQVLDSEKLLAIPDEKFRGFSDTERSNLVTQAISPTL